MVHTLQQEQFVPASMDQIWAYFSTPANLNEMTPPDMDFQILSGADEPMYAGQVIRYKVAILPGLRVTWVTQITHVEERVRFIDEQRIGPYRLWIHEHRFRAGDGGVWMTDRVTYALPFGPLGELAHVLFVRPRLRYIFDYRRSRVAELFGDGDVNSPPADAAPMSATPTDRHPSLSWLALGLAALTLGWVWFNQPQQESGH